MSGAEAEPARRRPRPESRREAVLDAAADLFARHGFEAVSMRDIAGEAGMLAGSLYYHFPSKDALFAEVHARAVDRITERLEAAVAAEAEPWARLGAALGAHLEGLLEGTDATAVLSPEHPGRRPELAARLIERRRLYEARLAELIADCPLRDPAEARLLRLFLLGAANWAPVWYRASGAMSPAQLGRALADLARRGATAERAGGSEG